MATPSEHRTSFVRIIPHPIDDRDHWASVRREPRHAPFLSTVAGLAKEAPERPVLPVASDFLAARRHNNRAVMDRHWKQSRRTLSALAMQRVLEGMENDPEDNRLLDWLWALLTEPTWTVSAHLPRCDLPASGQPTLDLASCTMAALFAELREVLKPWMDSISESLADSIVTEIDARVLKPYGDGKVTWWETPREGKTGNWLGVCAGSILAACESLGAQGHPRPEARERALAGLRKFLSESFTEHGECDEGIGYWAFGMRYACLGWSRLTCEEFDANVDRARLEQVADYPRKVHLAGNRFYSGNDGKLLANAWLEFIPWLAAATGSPFLANWSRHHPGHATNGFGPMLRNLAAPTELPSAEQETPSTSGKAGARMVEDQQVAILNAPTPDGNLQAVLTGGHNAERHNHNDLGHFVILLGEEIVVPDLGAPVYATDFFGPNRYNYVTASSRGHCCPLIEEHEQRPGIEAAGKVLEWVPAGERPRLVLDLTAAYPAKAGLKEWKRSLECRPVDTERRSPQMVIFDTFRTDAPGQRVTHVLWSNFKPENRDEFRVHGGGIRFLLGPLFCELSPSPHVVGKDELSAEELLLRPTSGQKCYRLNALYRTDDQGQLKVETRFFSAAAEPAANGPS